MEIDAQRDEDALVVVVRDHGGGIRPRADIERESLRMGLPLIAALSNSFEISGGPGQGTVVTMRLAALAERLRAEAVPATRGRPARRCRCPPEGLSARCSRG